MTYTNWNIARTICGITLISAIQGCSSGYYLQDTFLSPQTSEGWTVDDGGRHRSATYECGERAIRMSNSEHSKDVASKALLFGPLGMFGSIPYSRLDMPYLYHPYSLSFSVYYRGFEQVCSKSDIRVVGATGETIPITSSDFYADTSTRWSWMCYYNTTNPLPKPKTVSIQVSSAKMECNVPPLLYDTAQHKYVTDDWKGVIESSVRNRRM